jgi:hypothetical protein
VPVAGAVNSWIANWVSPKAQMAPQLNRSRYESVALQVYGILGRMSPDV